MVLGSGIDKNYSLEINKRIISTAVKVNFGNQSLMAQ